MSVFGEQKCPGCGLSISFIVDDERILRIPSQEEEDKRDKEILSWDFEKGRPAEESPLRKLARDLWVWLNTHTHGKSEGPTSPPEVIVVGSGPPKRSAAEILLHPAEPHFTPVTEPSIDLRSVCPRTGNIRDGDLKYAGSCGGYQCAHHTCTGASCSHCGGTGRCPEKAAGKK